MSVPCKRTFSLGSDGYGRPLFLIEEGGKWTLHRKARDQRDNDLILDLTGEQMANLLATIRAA